MKNVIISSVILIFFMIVGMAILDYRMADSNFHTAVVTETVLRQPPEQAGPINDFDPWIVQVSFQGRSYLFPVTRDTWTTMAIGDRVLINKWTGFITGYTYRLALHEKTNDKIIQNHGRKQTATQERRK